MTWDVLLTTLSCASLLAWEMHEVKAQSRARKPARAHLAKK